ncbi:MAG: hypothetical protein ABI758_01495 [Candidatus Woesebacteria bacterium]
MAIQQKAPSLKENFAPEDTVTYKLSLSTPKKGKVPPSEAITQTLPPALTTDLLKTGIVFLFIIGVLVALYFKLK